MKDPDKIPHYIMADLGERGLTYGDVREMTPEQLFSEYCNWHGLIGWGELLVTVIDELRAADTGNREESE